MSNPTLQIVLFVLSASIAGAQTPNDLAARGFASYEAGNFAEALSLFTRSCDADHPAGCAGVFQVHANGAGVPASRARAMPFGEKACALGHSHVCTLLGTWAREETPPDYTSAVRFYTSACNRSHAEACMQLGVLRMNGHGGPEDRAEGERLLGVACRGDNQQACANLGLLKVNAPEPQRDVAGGRQLLTTSCSRGNMTGCSFLGMVVRDGVGGPPDPAAAAPHFERACEGGMNDACLNLGDAYWRGTGVTRDPARARQLFARACSGGLEQACRVARDLAAAGSRPESPAESAPGEDTESEPRWTTRMGSVTIDGNDFRDVRSTCGMLMVTGVLQAIARRTRSCQLGGETPRLSLELQQGRARNITATPASAAARCVARRARRVRVGALSCRLDATLE